MNPLENTGLVYSVAIALGLLVPQFAVDDKILITSLLVIAMSISLMRLRLSRRDLRKNMTFSLRALLINYGLLSFSMLVMAYLFVPNPEHLAGFVIMAAVPPAVAVIPFTYLLGGDSKSSLQGEVVCYLSSLALAPLMTLAFLGSAIDVLEMLNVLVTLISVPFLASYFLRRYASRRVEPFRKSAVNLIFGVITYLVLGLNQPYLVGNALSILPLVLVLSVTSFGTGTLVYALSGRLGVSREKAISYSLFAGLKNGGMTAAFAVILVSPQASLPAAVHSVFTMAFFVFLQFVSRRF